MHVEESFIAALNKGEVDPPTAPTLYAVVEGGQGWIALPIVKFSLKAYYSQAQPLVLRVKLHGFWKALLSPSTDPPPSFLFLPEPPPSKDPPPPPVSLLLALPLSHKGAVERYEFQSPVNMYKPPTQMAEFDVPRQPQLPNLYLLPLPQVENGNCIDIRIRYTLELDPHVPNLQPGVLSCTFPLCFPATVTRLPLCGLVHQKLRLTFECNDSESNVKDVVISYPMIELIKSKTQLVFLRESKAFSDKDLTCSFSVPMMARGQMLHQESFFLKAVNEGLKLMSSSGVSFPLRQALFPTAPVVYAMISDIAVLDLENDGKENRKFQLPALVPLQMTKLSVKVNAEPKPDSVHVHFKGRWLQRCVKKGNSCPLVLGVPVGLKGCLLRYEMSFPDNQQVVKREELGTGYGPNLQNLYLVTLPEVDGGAEVCIEFSYVQDVINQQGLFSFSIPFAFPYYASQIVEKLSTNQKIRVLLTCKDAGKITKCDVPSHSLLELLSDEKMRILQQESRAYSDKDLTCSFTVI